MLWVLIRIASSNEYPQHTFLWRKAEVILMITHNLRFYGEITKIILKYRPYLFHWTVQSRDKHLCGKIVKILYAVPYMDETKYIGQNTKKPNKMTSVPSKDSLPCTSGSAQSDQMLCCVLHGNLFQVDSEDSDQTQWILANYICTD